jgi:hypothetical protein
MKIDESDLDSFATEIVDKCFTTRRDRVGAYSGLKHYFLFGASEGEHAPFNMIYPHLDLLTSFLYSQSTVEFDVAVDDKPEDVYEQAGLLGRRANMYFHDHGIADHFADALLWALVYSSSFIKLNTRTKKDKDGKPTFGGFEPYFVQPHDLGVLNESVANLNRQEAFAHNYRVSYSELKRRVSVLPNGADIIRRVTAQPSQQEDVFPEAVNRVIIAGTTNFTSQTTRGLVNIPDLLGQIAYKPRTTDDMVEMYELWVWDDDAEDYRTITVAAPGVVIYGRKSIGNIFIPGEQPFVHVCPNPLPDYFFGWSEMANLVKLQDWATERLREIRKILQKQASPPKALSGFSGITDEKIAALDNAASWISEPNPNAKVEMLPPDLPNDLFQEIMMIQGMFNDESGLSAILQGKGESGVRAGAHADVLAKLGSARIKKRALAIERSLEEAGGKVVRVMKAKDKHRYKPEAGPEFIAGQFTDEFEVHVDAHSASPVFVDDHVTIAFQLRKFGAISEEDLIRMVKPPRTEALVQGVRKMRAMRDQQMQKAAALGLVRGKQAA